MLLFSTLLDIEDSLTPDDFIRLVIEWNQKSPYRVNVIPDLRWQGERNVRFGSPDLWLDIREESERRILAVRYEKHQEDGIIWDTDYVMNFPEMRMAIRLERSYQADAQSADLAFSTPYFLSLLINRGYLKEDGNLPILRRPLEIGDSELEMAASIMRGERRYRLPVVYISRKYNEILPVDVNLLSSRLKGAAHVLVQKEYRSNQKLRELTKNGNDHDGSIGIYFPQPSIPPRRYVYRGTIGNDRQLLEKVVRTVILYGNSLETDPLYTWQGVNHEILRRLYDEQRKAKLAAESENSDLWQTYEQESEDFRRRFSELTRENERLRAENEGLKSKLDARESVPLLFMGDESDLYPGEVRDILLEILTAAKNNVPPDSRKMDVLRDVLRSNPYEKLSRKRAEQIKALLRDFRGITKRLRQSLVDLGFSITEDGKHYKITFCGDNRYVSILAKTPSDNRSGKNNVEKICNKCF